MFIIVNLIFSSRLASNKAFFGFCFGFFTPSWAILFYKCMLNPNKKNQNNFLNYASLHQPSICCRVSFAPRTNQWTVIEKKVICTLWVSNSNEHTTLINKSIGWSELYLWGKLLWTNIWRKTTAILFLVCIYRENESLPYMYIKNLNYGLFSIRSNYFCC